MVAIGLVFRAVSAAEIAQAWAAGIVPESVVRVRSLAVAIVPAFQAESAVAAIDPLGAAMVTAPAGADRVPNGLVAATDQVGPAIIARIFLVVVMAGLQAATVLTGPAIAPGLAQETILAQAMATTWAS